MMVTVPLVAIVYATIKIASVIVQTHLQMSALANSIGGYNNVNRLDVSLTRQFIHSCKNVLVICVAVLVLSVPLVCTSVAVSLWGYERLSVSCGFTVFWIAACNSFVNSLIFWFSIVLCVEKLTTCLRVLSTRGACDRCSL